MPLQQLYAARIFDEAARLVGWMERPGAAPHPAEQRHAVMMERS
jgi:hypothetical protein